MEKKGVTPIKRYSVNDKVARVKLLDGSMLSGAVNIGDHDRLSDCCNDASKLCLIVYKGTGGVHDRGGVFIIPKTSISYVEPIEKKKLEE